MRPAERQAEGQAETKPSTSTCTREEEKDSSSSSSQSTQEPSLASTLRDLGVFLLAPADVDVTADERRRIAEAGFYSYQ